MNSKKGLILLSIFLFISLLIPAISADAVINPTRASSFNLGDRISITGHITLNKGVKGAKVFFYAENPLIDKSILIEENYYSFYEDAPATFSQINKGSLSWKIPSNISPSNKWRINVKVKKTSKTYANFSSSPFQITDDLTVLAGINHRLFNLGDELKVSGTVLSSEGEPINGVADVYIQEKNYGKIDSGEATAEDGYLQYSYQFSSEDFPGNYTAKVEINDTEGNEGTVSVEDIYLTNSLTVESEPRQVEMEPGGSTIVTGEVTNIRGESLEDLTVEGLLTVPNQESATKYEESSDSNGKFSFTVKLPEAAPPGKYPLKVEANDSHGNIGKDEHTLYVGVIRNLSLSLKLNETSVYEGEVLNLSYRLKNKGNVDISGTLKLYSGESVVKEREFKAPRGEMKEINELWKVSETAGLHDLHAVAFVEGNETFESGTSTLQVMQKEKALELELTPRQSIIAVVIALIAIFVYLKRRDIREYFWHKELREAKEEGKET